MPLVLVRPLLLGLAALFVPVTGAADETWTNDRFAPLDAPPMAVEELERLDRKEVLVRDLPASDVGGLAVMVLGVVDAPPERLWRVMADCDEQDEFLPRITHAEVRDRDGDAHTCDLVVDMPYPMDDARTTTRQHVRRLPDGGYQRRWALSEESAAYRRNRGSWTVHPHAGDRSLLVSRMDLVPSGPVPLWVLRLAQTRQAPGTFDAIRERVRSLPERAEAGDPAR